MRMAKCHWLAFTHWGCALQSLLFTYVIHFIGQVMSDGKNNCSSLSPVNTPLIIHDSADLIEMKDNDDCNGVDKEKEQTQPSQSNDRFVYEKVGAHH